MLKGYRTYISLGCAFIANILPTFTGLPKEVSEAATTLFLALAAYYRSQAEV